MKTYPYACLALSVLALSGCSSLSKFIKQEAPPAPTRSNTHYNTETFWGAGKKPAEIAMQVKSESGIISFYDTSNGKEVGFTKFVAFGQLENGKYKFDRIEADTANFIGPAGSISISPANPSATLYVPQEGFLIFRGYANKQLELEVVQGQVPNMANATPQVARAMAVAPIDRQMPHHKLGELSSLPEPNLDTLDQRLSEGL